MPVETIVMLVGIVVAFGAFAGVLAWGDRQTRHLAG